MLSSTKERRNKEIARKEICRNYRRISINKRPVSLNPLAFVYAYILKKGFDDMKYVFVSDIHGSVEGLRKVIDIYKKENVDKLVILGDTASSMNAEDNRELAQMLNGMKNNVEVIRGNCDTISFEEMLDFEMYDMDILYIMVSLLL